MKPIVDSLKVLGESTGMFESLRDNLFAPKGLKFNSQICTSREQSERLLALGLKPETADMYWWDGRNWVYNSPFSADDEIPAWSLHRLVSILINNGIIITFIENIVIIKRYKAFEKSYEFWDDLYDNLIEGIEWLIKEGYFNKEYLINQKNEHLH